MTATTHPKLLPRATMLLAPATTLPVPAITHPVPTIRHLARAMQHPVPAMELRATMPPVLEVESKNFILKSKK